MAMGRFLLTLPPSGSTAGEVAFFVVEKTKWFQQSKDWGENLFVEKGAFPNKTIFHFIFTSQ